MAGADSTIPCGVARVDSGGRASGTRGARFVSRARQLDSGDALTERCRLAPEVGARGRFGRAVWLGGMLARGGLEVDLQWDMQKRVVNMNITSKTAQTLELYFPSSISLAKATHAESRPSSRGANYLDLTVSPGKKAALQVELQ